MHGWSKMRTVRRWFKWAVGFVVLLLFYITWSVNLSVIEVPTLIKTQGQRSAESEYAFVTLLTSNDAKYIISALTLYWSYKSTNITADFIVLALEKEVPAEMQYLITSLGIKLIEIKKIPEKYFTKEVCGTERFNRLSVANRQQRWGRMFSKLRLWDPATYSTRYTAIVYLDTDTLCFPEIGRFITQYLDITHKRGKEADIIIGEKGKEGRHSGFNAGFMILAPSKTTFTKLMREFELPTKPPEFFGNFLDCTEQAFLNKYYLGSPDHHIVKLEDSHKYPKEKAFGVTIGRPDVFEVYDYRSHMPPLIHWIGEFCKKPWVINPWLSEGEQRDIETSRYFNCEESTVMSLASLDKKSCDPRPYELWWKFWRELDTYLVQSSPRIRDSWRKLKLDANLICI